MRIYRITHATYAEDAFSGKGGLFAAGRWHSRGRLVAYASESLALAALEQLGRVGSPARLKELVYARAELDPEAVRVVAEEELPEGWNRRPVGRASQAFGDAWLAGRGEVGLRVPSVVLPEGYNVVLNPEHPDFGEALTVGEVRGLDPRIVERLREG